MITFSRVGQFTVLADEVVALGLVGGVVEGDETTMTVEEFVVCRVLGGDFQAATDFAQSRGVWSGGPVVERDVKLV